MAATETHRFTSKRNVPWIIVACLFVLAIALAGGWAFGFFFFPFIGLAVAVWLFYRVVRNVGVRNPLYDPKADSAHKWADGQPIGRSNRFEMESREMNIDDARFQAEKEDEQRRIDAECREEAARNRPNDYQGPPPVVPFP